MAQFFDPLLIMSLALNFVALGVSRIRGVINAVAAQGILLGILALFVHPDIGLRGILLVVVTIVLKGFVIPRFLVHAMREANIQHEVKPVVGYMSSLLLGAVGTGLAMVFSYTLPLAEEHQHLLLVPASLSTVWTGFLMLTTRRKAIMQVLGYLLLENGIFLFGLLLLGGDAVPRRGRRPARPVHRRVRDGNHHPSHQPRVHLDQHRAPVGVEGIIDDLHADSVPPGDGGGDVRLAFRPRPAVALAVGGAGAPCPGRLGGLPAGRRPACSRAWEAGCLLDPLGKLVLGFQSVLFFLCSLYAPGYLALRPDRPNRVFCANLFLMLGIMTLVVLSHHLGLMWVAMEATTLVTRAR